MKQAIINLCNVMIYMLNNCNWKDQNSETSEAYYYIKSRMVEIKKYLESLKEI